MQRSSRQDPIDEALSAVLLALATLTSIFPAEVVLQRKLGLLSVDMREANREGGHALPKLTREAIDLVLPLVSSTRGAFGRSLSYVLDPKNESVLTDIEYGSRQGATARHALRTLLALADAIITEVP